MLTAARASMAVSSGSGAAVATAPEGGSPTAPSSSEDVNPSPDAAIDFLSTDGALNEMLGAPWGGNGILKKMRSSVIWSFRICSFSWSAQGNRWWEGLRWSQCYANHEQIRDERLVEISTLLIHSAPKQKSNQWTHLSPFNTRIHGEWLRYAKSTSQFH